MQLQLLVVLRRLGRGEDGERSHADGDREWSGDYNYGRNDAERSDTIEEEEAKARQDRRKRSKPGNTARKPASAHGNDPLGGYRTSKSPRDMQVLISGREDTLVSCGGEDNDDDAERTEETIRRER